MAIRLGMPNLGHTMESGKVVEWLKPVGTVVARGDLVAVVESDKVSMEVEAPAAGTLLAHVAELQVEIPVGATIAVIGEPGETLDATPPAAPAPPSPSTTRAPAVQPAAKVARALASPLARSTAERLGVDLATLVGTGPDGLITRADVERAAPDGAEIRVLPLAGARRRIAERMARAWREIPMVPLARELDVTALALERARSGGVSWTALVARAVAITLPRHPRLNAWFRGEAIHEVRSVDLAIAVALPDDLAVPVLRGAQAMSLETIGAELARLAAAARAGTLPGDAQADGTFTISNLGTLGIDAFQPIINPPQVAILGLGRIRDTDGGKRMSATLVFDHRALDGADGARFLAELAQCIAEPAALFS
jgi:pyruvate dehydrogenase E2 component (dihydrolipoamide acetyltransferase)